MPYVVAPAAHRSLTRLSVNRDAWVVFFFVLSMLCVMVIIVIWIVPV